MDFYKSLIHWTTRQGKEIKKVLKFLVYNIVYKIVKDNRQMEFLISPIENIPPVLSSKYLFSWILISSNLFVKLNKGKMLCRKCDVHSPWVF